MIADLLNNVLCVSCVEEIFPDDERPEIDNRMLGTDNMFFTTYCVEEVN
jgi:hypothetical protein